MFGPQIAAFRFAARAFARRARWSAIGGLFLLLALIFLCVAIWVAMAREMGVVPAALLFAFMFLVLGLAALRFSRYPPRIVPPATARQMHSPLHSPALSTAAIVNAVVMGIAAGRALRRPPRR